MRKQARGFSLIELMVTLAIVAVLAAIAIPSYRQYVLRSHRAEGKSALLNIAAAQEKFYVQNNTYADDDLLEDAPPDGLGISATTENGYYTIEITDGDDDSYSVTATAAGHQADDTDCTTFTLNQAGQKTASSTECWE
jgi:type IV pilus assembly protein PilE